MRKYFGTDGIRRIANTELSPELVYKVAKAGAYVLSKHTDHTPTILIGRDTRISGTLIESAMVAGFLSYGANVKLLGVIPKTEEIITDIAHNYKEIQKLDAISSTPVGYKYIVVLTICVDGNMPTFDSHKLADKFEKDVNELDNVYKAIVHVNPI